LAVDLTVCNTLKYLKYSSGVEIKNRDTKRRSILMDVYFGGTVYMICHIICKDTH